MNNPAGYIGRKTLSYVDHLLNMAAFSVKLAADAMPSVARGRAVVRWGMVEQVYFTAVQALPLIIPISLLVGSAVLAQFTKFSSQLDIGKLAIIIIIRELGPVITALLVILRSATAVTIEMGYMRVLNQVASLEMAGIDPLRLLAIPRFMGITAAMACLFIVFDFLAIFGGYLLVKITTSMPVDNYLPGIAAAITVSDITVGIVKALLFGVVISIVSLYHGFNSEKRITAIPRITSTSAIESFFYCVIVNIFVSVIFYF